MRRVSVRAVASRFGAAAVAFAPRRFVAEDAKAEAGAKTEAAEPNPLDEKVAELEAKLKDAQKEAKEMKERALYQAADADNARRIAKEDVAKAKDYAVSSFAKDMLEVSDTLAKAVEAFGKLEPDVEAKAGSILTGVKMSVNVLKHNMQRHGVEEIACKPGDAFDPNKHEALFKSPTSAELPKDTVAHVVKTGYMLKDRVLRATQVGVAEDQ